MKIAFTVHTAYHGYAWSSTPADISVVELQGYLKLIRTVFPVYAERHERYEGILCNGSFVVAFVAMNLSNWDFENRAAEFYAFAFVPKSQAAAVNFDQLLKMDCFRTPKRNAPVPEFIEYNGGGSARVTTELVDAIFSESKRPTQLDFSVCGELLQKYGDRGSNWRIFRTTENNWVGNAFSFEKRPEPSPDLLAKMMSEKWQTQSRSEPRNTPEPRVISLDHSDDPDVMLKRELRAYVQKELRAQGEELSQKINEQAKNIKRLAYMLYGLVLVIVVWAFLWRFNGRFRPFAPHSDGMKNSPVSAWVDDAKSAAGHDEHSWKESALKHQASITDAAQKEKEIQPDRVKGEGVNKESK